MLRNLRWLILVVLAVVPVRAIRAEAVASLPDPSGYVSDFAGVLTPETKQALEDLCTQVDHNAHAQIAVVTVKSMDFIRPFDGDCRRVIAVDFVVF